jgi:hypothetical protein
MVLTVGAVSHAPQSRFAAGQQYIIRSLKSDVTGCRDGLGFCSCERVDAATGAIDTSTNPGVGQQHNSR